jgi:hypothetical protein
VNRGKQKNIVAITTVDERQRSSVELKNLARTLD